MIAVFLLVTIRQEEKPELLPPPSPVTMVFESGRRNGPTLPEPSPQATPLVQAPPATEPPMPVPPQPPPPAATPPPSLVPPPAVELPPPSPPLEPAPAIRLPPPPVEPPVRPPPVRPPVKQAPTPKPWDFPAPMDFSFGKPLKAPQARARPQSTPRPPGTIDMSLGPARKGAANNAPPSDIDTDSGGPDWRNALSLWVSEHAYYPEQARKEGDEGDAKVHVVAQHNGRVTEVELIGKSGSMWLDLALQSMFRDAHIPPLQTEGNEPIEFNFTMHYILRRGP